MGYTNNVNQNTYDYAVLDFAAGGCNVVDNGVNSDEPGSTVGWLGSWVAGNSDIQSLLGHVRGYPGLGTCGNPGVSCNVRVWGDTLSATENNATATEVRHQADTSPGMSGSGFYQYADPTCAGCDEGPYVVGIHRAGSTSYNIARRHDAHRLRVHAQQQHGLLGVRRDEETTSVSGLAVPGTHERRP